MGTTTRQIIKNALNEIKDENNKNIFSYNIEIIFDSITFNKHNRNANTFWRVLTNTFNNYKEYKKTNNKWFKELNPDGFYFFTESYNLVQFRIFMETKKKIDFDELKYRVEQLVPILQLNYSVNNEFEFIKMFANDIFTIQKSKIQYIGENENTDSSEVDDSIDLPF